MNFDTIHLISRHIEPVPLSAVEELEAHLGIKLPTGYTAFITHFGVGTYCDLFRIFPPDRILKYLAEYRYWRTGANFPDSESKIHWQFADSDAVLSEAQLQESVFLGKSIDWDQLVYSQHQPDKIYILPREANLITWVNSDFSDLHYWDTPSPRLRTFVPWNNHRITLNFHANHFTINQVDCLEQFRAHWERDTLLIQHQRSNARSGHLLFYVPSIGGRVLVIHHEKVIRTYEDKHGNTTAQGNGMRYLNIRMDCDEEAAAEVNAFFAHLEAQGLITLLKSDEL